MLITGGSRTGKSSAVYGLLRGLLADPAAAPGLFLVDPHGSLADAFLQAIARLPAAGRSSAVERLRVITPGLDAVVPLNLLAVPDFNWAGSALVQTGQRIWGDFWGPRMQAALLALARLLHAWNRQHPEAVMGLGHLPFAAFNRDWRQQVAAGLPPEQQLGTAALDALLGQAAGRGGQGHPQWVTEVMSPIFSKVMTLELSPWLHSAFHQARFVDLEHWIAARAWVVLRLPAGEIGREGARLTAGMVYNIFEAAFRKATALEPAPLHFIIDETQEIAGAMQLESLLSEGGKFGARLFVLAQSLSLLRRMEGFEAVVQSLLANTSAQMFFSPDPDDAELVRSALSLEARFGQTTIDLPSLQAWLRARIDGQWQPPALVQVAPLERADPHAVRRVIDDAIAAHPEDYASESEGRENLQRAMQRLTAPGDATPPPAASAPGPDLRSLGW